ncbi:leucine Rich repeat-containing domain protein [Dictyocaulus viviparus]|uniref:Leucine Rich repeat-containing domain protein n=1 Tax=Dictyocaulus viviparus TaxID=29172 RepID=A0A0D8Y1G0_DICVI|nr:leucine Rich repeat-containing domain protein [Dictyocaulus viviparus]
MRLLQLLLLLLLIYEVHGIIECPRECECDAIPPNNSSWAVYCHNGGLNDTLFADILNRLPPSLKLLDIQVNSWRPPNKFKWSDNLNRFSMLKHLRLVNCAIPAMSRSTRLPSLEILDLNGNDIEHATMGNFGGMPNLRFLDLSNNHLSILPTGVFTFLHNLKSLSLANNSITELSANLLRGLQMLKSLRLDNNHIPIKQINDLFVDVPQLEELNLNDCQISSIANLSLNDVAQLRHLGLANNNLRTIPTQELQQLTHLAVLDLSGNDISEVGACAFCSNNISKLDLSHNRLGLVKQPFHVDAFRNIPLKELDLSFNHMNEFHSSSLGWAQEGLRTLNMAGNSLGGFHSDITATLSSLLSLNMAFNNIEHIPLAFPPQYYHLTALNISGNTLTYIPENLPYLLPSLKEFDISRNKFTTLTQPAIDYINELERVYLDNNPWDCSCSIQHIQQHMRQRYGMRHILRYHDVRCAEPELVKGQPILSVADINECAVLFGARYGLSQSSELFILLAALLSAALVLSLLLICLYLLRERQHKGSYVTREHSRTPLTMATHVNCSVSNSGTSEALTPPMPPPPPKATIAYFGI